MKTGIWIAAWAVWALTTGGYIVGGIRADQRSAPKVAELQRQVAVGDSDMLNALLMAREVKNDKHKRME